MSTGNFLKIVAKNSNSAKIVTEHDVIKSGDVWFTRNVKQMAQSINFTYVDDVL